MKLLSSDWPTCCDRKMTQIGTKPYSVAYQCSECEEVKLFASCPNGHAECAYELFMNTPEIEFIEGPVN